MSYMIRGKYDTYQLRLPAPFFFSFVYDIVEPRLGTRIEMAAMSELELVLIL